MKEKREDLEEERDRSRSAEAAAAHSFLFDCSLFRERGLINERDRAEGRRAYTAENVIPERPNFPALENISSGRLAGLRARSHSRLPPL